VPVLLRAVRAFRSDRACKPDKMILVALWNKNFSSY